MDMIMTLIAAVGLALVVLPVVTLLLTFFVLVPLAHLMPAPATVARASFQCPFSRRRVTAAFLTPSGSEHPADVVACSFFDDGIRCKKGCLQLAQAGWMPSAMTPPFSLVADGVAAR